MKRPDQWKAASRPPSRLLGEAEFSALTAAAEFAWCQGLYFNTHLTISWPLLGALTPEAAQAELTAFLKCQREWFDERGLPQAWIYAHECGPKWGLHTHIAMAIPGEIPGMSPLTLRKDYRQWAMGWPRRRLGRRAPRSMRVRGPSAETPWLHWVLAHYLMKGYDPSVVVQPAALSPDGRAVYLGDLIAMNWRDPGPVGLKFRVGVSRGLGPQRRAAGLPEWCSPRRTIMVDPFAGRWTAPSRPQPFRSSYEEGVRDVRDLYPEAFRSRIWLEPTLNDGPWADLDAIIANLDV